MKWVLAFHLIFVIAWFAGLFYLPRLFVYHAASSDHISIVRFKVMEKKLFWMIMTPAGIAASFFGLWLLSLNLHSYLQHGWMMAKLILVCGLWIYHIYCGFLLKQFARDKNIFSEKFYRVFNEIPTLLLIAIIIMAIVQP